MYSYNAQELLDRALIPLCDKYHLKDYVNGTVEIINAHLEFDANQEFMINLGSHRKPQKKYVENEQAWYLSLDRSIKGHPGIEDNHIWSRICTDEGRVNSNYGWCVFSTENGCIKGNKSQYDFALKQLMEKPEGRQSIIYYARPQLQWEWNDNKNAKSDFTCTINTQHFIRDNALHYIVNMRSNDAIFGLQAGDLPWHGYVYNKMYNELREHFKDDPKYNNLKKGKVFWNAASLHVYDRHFKLLDDIVEEYINWCKSTERN